MAGGGPSVGSSRRGRSLNADVNLVPFIDLLSVCICFLLMTAVWTQLTSLQVKQTHGTEGAVAEKSDTFDLEVRFIEDKRIQTQIKRQGRLVKKLEVKAADDPELITLFDQSIKSWIKTQGATTGKQLVGSAIITTKTGVNYGLLVHTMDALRRNEISNLGVTPVKN